MPEELGGGEYDAGSVYIGVGLDLDPIDQAIYDIPSKFQAIKDVCIPVKICPDLDHLQAEIKKVRIDCIPVELCIDDRKFEADLAQLRKSVELTATIDLQSVQNQIDAIAAQPRTIYYSAEVQMEDIKNLKSTLQATVDAGDLKRAAPDIGKSIAKEISEAKVKIDQGGFVSRVLLSGVSNVVRGFQESIGQEIFKGTSKQARARLRETGGFVEQVSSAVGGVVRDRALEGAGFAGVKDFEKAFKSFSFEKLLAQPFQSASEAARAAAVTAKVEGENAAKAYFSVFSKTLISEVKTSSDIKEAGIGAVGRVATGAINVAAPVQSFRRDVSIERAKRQAESIEVDLTPQEIESILRAKKQIIIGNAGYYNFEKGNSGNIVGAPTQRYLGQEFVGIENPSATKFLRGEALPPDLKAVINEEKTLSFFRTLAKSAKRLGIEVPKELANITDGAELEAVLLNALKGQNEEFRRVYLSAIESTFGGGINADLPQQIAKVKAIQKLRPDLEVKGLGFSGGGYYVDQLARATGIKAATLGTPFFQTPQAISGRGTADPQFDTYGKNAFLRQIQGPNFEDLNKAGALHSPATYFGKQNVRSFLNQSLDLGLSQDQLKTQGVDPRQLQDADKNIRKTVAALVEIAEAASYLEDISNTVAAYDFKGLSAEEVTDGVDRIFGKIEQSLSGFDKLIGDEIVDDARDRLTGITDHYRSTIERMVDQPEKIANAFDQYFSGFSNISTQALNVRASDVAQPSSTPQPDPIERPKNQRIPVIPPKKSQFVELETVALAEAVHEVTVEIAKGKGPARGVVEKIRQAESATADFLTGGRGAETKQALQLFAQYKLKTAGTAALQGGANAIRGGYGLAQGAESAVLGLVPFGLGYGAKRVAQAGVGFAALNSVGAGELALSAGSHLGGGIGLEAGQAFTAQLAHSLPGIFQPIAAGIGTAVTNLLQLGGGTVGAGAAALGAGATTFALGEKAVGAGVNAIAPSPVKLALKEAKQFELVGVEISQQATKSVLAGAQKKTQAYLAPAVSVQAEISPITNAFASLESAKPLSLPQAKSFSLVTPRPGLNASPTGFSESGALAQSQKLVIASQEARAGFLKLINDPAIKSGRIDLLYNAAVEAQRLVSEGQRAKDTLRQLAYENKGAISQQQITGSMSPIVRNAKEAEKTLEGLVKTYEKSGRDIGVFFEKGLAAGLSKEEAEIAAQKLVAIIQQTIESGFEIQSPSKWAFRAGRFIQSGLSLGLGPESAIAAAEKLADSVIGVTESRLSGKFKAIGAEFASGLTSDRSSQLRGADRQILTNRPKFMVEHNVPSLQDIVKNNPPNLETDIRAKADLAKALRNATPETLIRPTIIPKGYEQEQIGLARVTGSKIVQALSLGMSPERAIAAANLLADKVISTTEKGFGSRFKGIGTQFVLGIQDEIVKGVGGRRILIDPFSGADDAIKHGAQTTIAEIRNSAQKVGLEIAKTNASIYEKTDRGFRRKLFTPFEGVDNAVQFTGKTKIAEILADAKRQGIEYEKTVRQFELVRRGEGQIPVFKRLEFTPFKGKDDRVPFNLQSPIGEVARKAGLDPIQSNFEYTGRGVQKRRFTELPQEDLQQFAAKVRRPEDAFKSGEKFGQQFGEGLKSSGRFIGQVAKDIGDRLPTNVTSGSQSALEATKGFFSGLKSQFSSIKDDVPLLGKITKGIKDIAVVAGVGFIGFQAFQTIQQQAGEAYKAIKELQSQKISLEISTGNLPRALEFTSTQADKLGLGLNSIRSGYSGIAAALRGGSLAPEAENITSGLVKAVSALQLSDEENARVFTQFKQIASKPKLQTEDLITLSESLPGAPKIAERALGLKEGELPKLLETGQISSTVALPKIAAQFEKEFGSAVATSSKSAQAIENRFKNTALVLQQDLGEQALPLITSGLKAATSAMNFLVENSDKFSVLLNVALLGGLALASKSILGLIGELGTLVVTEVAAAGGMRLFAQESSKVAVSSLGKVAALAAEFALFAAAGKVAIDAIGLFGDKAGNVTEAIDKITKAQNEFAKAVKGTPSAPIESKGQYGSFDELFKDTGQDIGAAQKLKDARKEDEKYRLQDFFFGGIAGSTIRKGITKGDIFFDTKQRQIVTQKVEKAEQVEELVGQGVSQVQSKISKAGGLNLLPVSEFQATKKSITEQDEALQELIKTADSIKERNIYENARKQLAPLIKSFETGKEATLDLAKAFKELSEVNLRTERNLAEATANSATDRGQGLISDYQAQVKAIKDQNQALEDGLPKAQKYVDELKKEFASADYKTRADKGQVNVTEDQNKLLAAEKEVFGKRQQLGENLTKARETEYNRRSELLQREVSEQERAQSRLEGLRRLSTTGRDANLSQSFAGKGITPQTLRITQIDNTQSDAKSAFEEQVKRRADALKNLKRAQQDLQKINPNDEQQYEQGKAAVAQYEQAVLTAGAEINNQRKAYFDAQKQREEELLSLAGQVSDLAARKEELSVDRRIKAVERLSGILKRDSDNRIAAIERENKLIGKQGEILTAQNNIVQVRGGGRVSGLKTAEDLARQIEEPKEETEQSKKLKRDRLKGILGDLGVGFSEEKIFQRRVEAENQLAKTKQESLNLELNISSITLEREQKKEEIVRRSAITQAQAAERIARSNLDKSGISVQKAEIGLDLAKRSGDPLKVREAQLTLEQAQLDYSAAAGELPNATNAVNQALLDLAQSIKESELQKSLVKVQGDTKRSQFGLEERDRGLSTRIDAANKGFGKPTIRDASGLVSGLDLKNDPGFRQFSDGFTRNKTGVNTYAPDLRLLSRSGAISPVPLPKFDYASPGPDPGKAADQFMGGFEKLFAPLTESVNLQKAMVQLLSMIQNKPVTQVTNKSEVKPIVYSNPFEGQR